MTQEELKLKYGDSTVLGVDKSIVEVLPARGIVTRRIDPQFHHNVGMIENNLVPRLRCEAELNPAFKQVIPYVVLRHSVTGDVFMAARVGGDNRLQGMISIGLGGHMDEGENFITCLLRELREEVDLKSSDIDNLTLYGYLYDEDNEVDSVHLGVVYILHTHRTDLRCIEADKQIGAWFPPSQLTPFREAGLMESWSAMMFDALTSDAQTSTQKCDVCGKTAPVHVACCSYGPVSLAYCNDCLREGLEPYGAVVLFIASVGHFPEEISEYHVEDVRRMLPLWGKTEEEFIQDVENKIKELEGMQ